MLLFQGVNFTERSFIAGARLKSDRTVYIDYAIPSSIVNSVAGRRTWSMHITAIA